MSLILVSIYFYFFNYDQLLLLIQTTSFHAFLDRSPTNNLFIFLIYLFITYYLLIYFPTYVSDMVSIYFYFFNYDQLLLLIQTNFIPRFSGLFTY